MFFELDNDNFEVEEPEGHEEPEPIEELLDDDEEEPFMAFSFGNSRVEQDAQPYFLPMSRYTPPMSRESDGSDVAASRVSDYGEEIHPGNDHHGLQHVKEDHVQEEDYHDQEEDQQSSRRRSDGDCAKSDPIWTVDAIERLKQERQERSLVANEIRKQQREKRDRERQEQKKQFEERQYMEVCPTKPNLNQPRGAFIFFL